MIISSIPKKGDVMVFPRETLIVLNVSKGINTVNCKLKDEALNQIRTKSFRRIGGEIKSGVDIGNCQKYIPAEKKPQAGEKIYIQNGLSLTIKRILKKLSNGKYRCLVSYSEAISCFPKTIRL